MTYLVLTKDELQNLEQALFYASRYLKGDQIPVQVRKKVDYSPKLETYQNLINKLDKEIKA